LVVRGKGFGEGIGQRIWRSWVLWSEVLKKRSDEVPKCWDVKEEQGAFGMWCIWARG